MLNNKKTNKNKNSRSMATNKWFHLTIELHEFLIRKSSTATKELKNLQKQQFNKKKEKKEKI